MYRIGRINLTLSTLWLMSQSVDVADTMRLLSSGRGWRVTSADTKNPGYTHRGPRPPTGARGKLPPTSDARNQHKLQGFFPNFSTKIQTEINTERLVPAPRVRNHEGLPAAHLSCSSGAIPQTQRVCVCPRAPTAEELGRNGCPAGATIPLPGRNAAVRAPSLAIV